MDQNEPNLFDGEATIKANETIDDTPCEGQLVLLVDNKGRRYILTVRSGDSFQTHAGSIPHDTLLTSPIGSELKTTRGQKFRLLTPSLAEFIINMPRGAQVIYPKDIGAILMMSDIRPGLRVFESGVGSGALSMAMLQAGAYIVGYDLRQDFIARAEKNVVRFLGDTALARYKVEHRDAYEGIDCNVFDRVVLDLPEPWRVVPHAAETLQLGGILLAYSPAITQSVQTTEALRRHGFFEPKTTEVLHRGWNIDGSSVRPDHRMVAHTGFLTMARYVG